MAASENGCAGQECRPCPKAVTSMGEGRASGRSDGGGPIDRDPTALARRHRRVEQGSSVAMVQPGGTS